MKKWLFGADLTCEDANEVGSTRPEMSARIMK